MYLDSSNRFHLTGSRVSQCPRCRAQTHLTATATPDFQNLQRLKPATAGVVFHCDACHAPVFRKYRIKQFGRNRIDFHPDGRDVEKRDDQFNSNYLPPMVAAYYKDALGCYQAGLVTAFAAMCRLTIQAVISEHGDSMQLKLYDQVDDIASLAELDDHAMMMVQDILFDSRADSIYQAGELDRGTAAILLEIMKDLLHQAYIRRGRLRKALRMRQFFARRDSNFDHDFSDAENEDIAEEWDTTVTSLPLDNSRPTGTSKN